MKIRHLSLACRCCGLALLLLCLWVPLAAFGQAHGLGEFLDDQGRLSIPEGFSGSLDPEGFEMQTSADGTPRFVVQGGIGTVAGEWEAFGGMNSGCNGEILAMAIDESGRVYLGGRFTVCGTTAAHYVALYDPVANQFEALKSGGANGVGGSSFSSPDVSALALSGGELYAGGSFTEAGGNPARGIARWDGKEWHSLGIGDQNGVSPASVFSLAVSDSDVYVGGQFIQAGGQPANRVARWDGSEWHSLGTGGQNGVNNRVWALAVSGNDVYVGGAFGEAGGQSANRVARWNGNEWQPLESGGQNGVNGTVYALAASASDVYVGGRFTEAGGESAIALARWDGSAWHALESGGQNGVNSVVRVLTVSGSNLYVGGQFVQAGGQRAYRVARWDGDQWHALGSDQQNGLDGVSRNGGINVRALAVSEIDVFVGGAFDEAGAQSANNVARWNGADWDALEITGGQNGLNNIVSAVAVLGADLYVGGRFTEAGGQRANFIARWDGTDWHALESGGQNGVNNWVNALAVSGSDLYVGGFFSQAGGKQTTRVARWDGTDWHALGSSEQNGTDFFVNALVVSGSDVYVAGAFTRAGGQAANNIARWDGSQWHTLGSGEQNGVNFDVNALAASGGELYVGGKFTAAGGQPALYVARWDGNAWHGLGSGVSGIDPVVRALTVSGSDVYVGGEFLGAGGQLANNIARWDGSAWHALESGGQTGIGSLVDINISVRALATSSSGVYVGGAFTEAGGQPINFVSNWDGSGWSSLGDGAAKGVNQSVNALAVAGPVIHVGGEFGLAGEELSSRLATFEVAVQQEIDISPSEIDFGDIELGSTSIPQVVTIENTGEVDLDIQSVLVTGVNLAEFPVVADDCTGETLAPQSECTLEVVFSPTGSGERSAQIDVRSSAQSSLDTVTLSGNGMINDQPVLDLSPASVNFGEVAIGGSSNQTTTVENTGSTALDIESLALAGPAANDYILDADNCSGSSLAPGETCSYNVGVAPSETGLREAAVDIVSNAFSSPDQQTYIAIGIEAPVMAFEPDGFDFGAVPVSTTEESGELLVKNAGSADLIVNFIQLVGTDADDFSLILDQCSATTVAAGDSCAFEFSFSPSDVGTQAFTVWVDSNAGLGRFFIRGRGVNLDPELDLNPNLVDFGNVAGEDASAPISLVFSNPGSGALTVTAVDPAEAPFTQAAGTCGAVPFSVAAGDSCAIDYQFQPTDPGDFVQTITVESDAIAGSDTEFSLTGTSGQFDVAVMKSNAAEFVLPGVATIYDIQVLNLGLSDLFGVGIVDVLPPELDATAATWTCTPGTGVACPVDSGVGDIDEIVDLPAGAGMAFTLIAPVIADEGVDVVNTVTATMPAGTEDEDPSNNEATDSDPVAIFAGDFEFAGCSDDLIENRFCVTGENVVLDIVTGLEWQRCPLGRVWDETNQICTGEASGVEWDDAVVLAPDGGWRLPSVEELSTLRYCSDGDPALFLPSVSGPGIRCDNVGNIIQPVIEPEAFPNWPLNAPVGPPWFWTTTDGPDFEDSDGNIIDGKIAVSFGEGSILNVNKISPIQVLLVRD